MKFSTTLFSLTTTRYTVPFFVCLQGFPCVRIVGEPFYCKEWHHIKSETGQLFRHKGIKEEPTYQHHTEEKNGNLLSSVTD